MRYGRRFSPVHAPPQPDPGPSPARQKALRHRIARFYSRFQVFVLMGAGVLIALAGVYLYDATRPPPQRLTQRDIDVAVERSLANAPARPSYAAQAYGVIGPSVVRVEAIVPGRGRTGTSLGSGVVVDDTGTILTALHVVRGAVGVRVLFADGTDSEALIVMAQAENDLAVLRPAVVPDDLVPATLASSATLRVGDEVVAVGSPFGIPTSVSAGVVSGLGRSHRLPGTGETLRNLIQFDAAVNPGNSGGPLVNRDGEVVGIVVALLNPTEQDVFIGIGFAVTMETAGGLAGAPPL